MEFPEALELAASIAAVISVSNKVESADARLRPAILCGREKCSTCTGRGPRRWSDARERASDGSRKRPLPVRLCRVCLVESC